MGFATSAAAFLAQYWPFVAAMTAAGVAGGLLAGLLGIGGGIVIVPVLLLILTGIGVAEGLAIKIAVATSLTTIAFTSLASARSHAARGAVDFTLVKSWLVPVIAGTIAGAGLGGVADGRLLQAVFAVVATLAALNMAFGLDRRFRASDFPNRAVKWALGAVVGLVSALMGIGGGTLSVPILSGFGFPVKRAIGTGAAVGFVVAVPGAAAYVLGGLGVVGLPAFSLGYVNWMATLAIIPLTLVFAPIGARMAHAIPSAVLRVAFALFLLATAARMLVGLLT